MTATEALERRIDELCRENEKLRQDNDRLIQAIEDLHDVRLEDRLVQLENENDRLLKELEAEHALAETLGHHHEHAQSENERLRGLVRYAHECAIHSDHATCDDCRRMNSKCILADRMRELGIEVSDG